MSGWKSQGGTQEKSYDILRWYHVVIPNRHVPHVRTSGKPGRIASGRNFKYFYRNIHDYTGSPDKRIFMPCPLPENDNQSTGIRFMGRATRSSPYHFCYLPANRKHPACIINI